MTVTIKNLNGLHADQYGVSGTAYLTHPAEPGAIYAAFRATCEWVSGAHDGRETLAEPTVIAVRVDALAVVLNGIVLDPCELSGAVRSDIAVAFRGPLREEIALAWGASEKEL
jgi:hypothetical protein